MDNTFARAFTPFLLSKPVSKVCHAVAAYKNVKTRDRPDLQLDSAVRLALALHDRIVRNNTLAIDPEEHFWINALLQPLEGITQ